MPNILDSNGLQIATQAELLNTYTTALQVIYGPDINLQSDAPDGQWVSIQIQTALDTESLLMQIYNSFDPDQAIGVSLDQRCAINGIIREAGTYTITNVTLVVTQALNLYGLDQSTESIYTVADASGNQWQLITSQLGLSAGTYAFAFQAANPGAILTIPNTITVPVTIVIGISSINNPTSYTSLGINEESDVALRVRRSQSVSNSSQGYLQGLLGTLLNINGVIDAFVYENTSSGTDGDGVPGHSIWVIVDGTPSITPQLAWNVATTYSYGNLVSQGGVDYISWQNNNTGNAVTNPAFWGVYNPIAQAIYSKRNAGCGMYGSTSYTITQIDGTSFIVFWDQVIEEPLYIKFTATSLDGIHAPNIAGILQQLPEIYMPGVFAEVNINQLATLVQQIDPNTLVTNSGFSTSSGGTYTATLTPTAKNYQFQVASNTTIILSMILTAPNAVPVIVSGVVTQTTVSIVHGISHTLQFTGLGGYGTYTYSVTGTGTINSSTGLYTAPASAGTDTVMVTDSLSNTAISVVTIT